MAVLVGALALSACHSSPSSDATGRASAAGELRLGQPTPSPQPLSRFDRTGLFTLTPEKVVAAQSTAGGPATLGRDRHDGQRVVWVYVRARQAGGHPVTGPMLLAGIDVETSRGGIGSRLISVDPVPGAPVDCTGDSANAEWRRGDTRTVCAPYLIPDDSTVARVLYSPVSSGRTLAWRVP
ncbi:hypothetical protein [Streptomyces sp. NBC_00470]|uniref:hypothetical protein n=1 Tax=Streptomyces sp. NBC_00470 TaxID=2975753 RepID=UPI002F909A0D